jgi:ElaA protein
MLIQTVPHLRAWDQLSLEELYALLQFRQEVFVVEQHCPYLDADGKDPLARHLWLDDREGRMLAYCRLLPPGVSYPDHASIGRVISRAAHRASGLGRQIMLRALEETQGLWPGAPIRISAQCYLEDFYTSLGFRGHGEVYPEDDIPHRAMDWEGAGRGLRV